MQVHVGLGLIKLLNAGFGSVRVEGFCAEGLLAEACGLGFG